MHTVANAGFSSLKRGELEEAERVFQACLDDDPEDARALEGLAEVAIRRNQAERYLRLTTQLLGLSKGLSPARRVTLCHRQADVCLEQLDAPQRAVEVLARIELDHPGSADALRARRRIEQILDRVERREELEND